MKTVALVPVKALPEAKTRLARHLPAARRLALAEHLFIHVVDAILASDAVDLCAVVSPDPAVLAAAQARGAVPLAQQQPGLNPGLEEGRAWALRQAAEALLIVLGDLPLITPADVAALVALAVTPGVVLAPDRHGTGSNALLLAPPDLLPFHFGRNSALAHAAEAHRRGVPVHPYLAVGTALDLDTPDDLDVWLTTQMPAALGG